MGIETILGVVISLVGLVIFFLDSSNTNEAISISRYFSVDTIDSIHFGMSVVVKRTVTSDQPLTSPVTKKPCVYYEYTLEKETETKDRNGQNSWEWEQIGSSQL